MPANRAAIVWISHRGFKEAAAENTHAAFTAAVEQGFTTLETDLRMTVDGHVVLHHDAELTRLAGDARSLASLRRRDLASVRLRGRQGDYPLLFLDEFAAAFAAQDWVFDIKPETGAAVIAALAELAKAGALPRLVERTKFVVWSASHEAQLLDLWPQAVVYAREPECWRAGVAVLSGLPLLGAIRAGRTYALPPRLGPLNLYTPGHIDAFHRRGARVLAFLPESAADVATALACGVDEVLTNGTIAASMAGKLD